MYSFRRWLVVFLSAVWGWSAFADVEVKSIREELKEMLAEQGLEEGVDRRARAIVAIGISWSEKEPELVARALAAGRISCHLNGATISALRSSIEGATRTDVSSVVKRLTEGYVTGLREVARVTRRNKNGRLAVGIALRWTMRQEMDSADALSLRNGEECELEKELGAVAHIVRMAGPHVWTDGQSNRTRLLGIGVAEVKANSPMEIRVAIRLAQIKARRYLLFHFCQYNKDMDVLKRNLSEEADVGNGASDLDSLHIVKARGVIAPGCGITDIYEKMISEDGHRYAVCVACVSREN